jgi:hypothetical protein
VHTAYSKENPRERDYVQNQEADRKTTKKIAGTYKMGGLGMD